MYSYFFYLQEIDEFVVPETPKSGFTFFGQFQSFESTFIMDTFTDHNGLCYYKSNRMLSYDEAVEIHTQTMEGFVKINGVLSINPI